MSSTSEHSKSAKQTQSTLPKLTGSKSGDLELVAERLSLIQGHISHMPDICISGVRIMDGFLLVALKVTGHELTVENGSWMLDKKDVTDY
jgi:hypothetical protein